MCFELFIHKPQEWFGSSGADMRNILSSHSPRPVFANLDSRKVGLRQVKYVVGVTPASKSKQAWLPSLKGPSVGLER